MIALLARQVCLPMLQKRPYPLISISTHSRMPASLIHTARFPMHLVSSLHNTIMEPTEPRALHDAPNCHEGEQERHECEVAHLDRAFLALMLRVILPVPPLPVLPRRIRARIAGPPLPVVLPVVCMARRGRRARCVVVACPSGAPGIVGFPLLGVGEDVVRGDEHAVALETHGEREGVGAGAWVAAVGVVEFDEGVVAGLLVRIALLAVQDLIGGGSRMRAYRLRPAEQVCFILAGVCCVGSAWCRVRGRRCMTT